MDEGQHGESTGLGQGNLPLSLSAEATEEAERRFHEAQIVTPATFSELSHVFGQAFLELKRNYTKITFEKLGKEKRLDEVRGELLIDHYPKFLEDHPKLKDTADIKKAFLSRNSEISELLNTINLLTAMEMVVKGKIEHIELTLRAMKAKMDVIKNSGVRTNLY